MSRHLHIVTCISNPVGFNSRYRLYKEFEERMLREPNVTLWTVEIATGEREHAVTQHDHPHHLQLRTRDELWHKENMINLMVNTRIPQDGHPIAVVDADVIFTNPHWVKHTIEALDTYDVVQMFHQCVDFGPTHAMVKGEFRTAMAYNFVQGVPCAQWKQISYNERKLETGGHCGYAWAWRREAFDKVGGLFEHSVVGASDWFMACGLMGEIEISIPGNAHPNFRRRLLEWGDRARTLRRNVGYVPGVLGHYWHGPKSERGYFWRNSILEHHKIDPDVDMHYDHQGLLALTDDGSDRYLAIRNSLRNYFRSRKEDSIEDTDHDYK